MKKVISLVFYYAQFLPVYLPHVKNQMTMKVLT